MSMISSVSNISFKSNAQDLINSPGAFATQAPKAEAAADEFVGKKKSKSAAGLITTLVVALAAFAGLGYAVKSGKLTKVENAEKFMDKYIKNPAAKVGGWAETCWNKITGLFGGKKAAEKAADAAQDAAAAATTATA